MEVLVVGSIGLDTVTSPFGEVVDALGGSASYFALGARLFTGVRLVSVVGQDFPDRYRQVLGQAGVLCDGIETREGKTFRWSGVYGEDINERRTRWVELNVLAEFDPVVPEDWRDTKFVFLANASPRVQLNVLDELSGPEFVLADTIDHWIENEPDALQEVLGRVDGVVLNDGEIRLLTGKKSLIAGAKALRDGGVKCVVVKKGEHGSMLLADDDIFVIPAYPTEDVKDPTGAGDSFAGGLMGWVASRGSATPETLRLAMAYGTIVASFTVQTFSVDGLVSLSRGMVEERLEEFRRMTRF